MKNVRYFLLVSLVLVVFSIKAQDTLGLKPGLLFNIQSALIGNNSVSNMKYSELHPTENSGYNYFQDKSKIVSFGYSGATELIYGKNPRLKEVFGLTYELTNSAFYFHNNYLFQLGHGATSGDSSMIHYNRKAQAAGIYWGLMFPPYKKFSICLLAGLNGIFWRQDIKNGYEIKYGTGNWLSPGSWRDSTNYNNVKDLNTGEGNGFAFYFRLRVCYKINSFFSAFASGNLGLGYVCPWFMLGLQYYPFKKFR